MSTSPAIGQGSVTVIIAAYNAAGTIARAIRSALNEPKVAEVIVVDDTSFDQTVAIARNADNGTGRLSVLVQERNQGPAAARNRAIASSRTAWLCVLDADDFFLPGRFRRLAKYADNADLIADDFYQLDESRLGETPEQAGQRFFGTAPRHMITFREFVASNVTRHKRARRELGFIKPLMRRDFLARHQLRYNETLRLGEDYELYARLLAHGARLRLIDSLGYVAVTRAASLSGQHSIHDLQLLRDCDRALAGLANLTAGDRHALQRHYASIDCRLQWRRLIEAVKRRDRAAALACFRRPWPVPLYLTWQLSEQAILRLLKRLRSA